MASIPFTTEVIKKGTHTVIELPFNPHTVWGEKQRHDVNGTINNRSFRGPVRSDAGYFYLVLGPAWCRDLGITAGSAVEVVLDAEGPQVDLLAEDIASGLRNQPNARRFFESLPTFYRKNYIRWIESAKREETRQARIRAMLELLSAGKRAPGVWLVYGLPLPRHR